MVMVIWFYQGNFKAGVRYETYQNVRLATIRDLTVAALRIAMPNMIMAN